MKNRFLSLLCVLALCLGLLPVTALAAAPIGQVLYVGGVQISSTGYWTTDSDGNVTASTAGETPTDNYISYDAENNVLTLHNATIKNELEFNESIEGGTFISGSAIGVFNNSGNAELTISLVGTNTIAEVGKGIFVLANSASTGSSNLTIQGYGSLNASASQTGIWVQSNSKNAALCVENAEVTASSGVAFKNGVLVQAEDGSDVSLTVNGGSLTASVNANIWFQFGTGVSGSGTPTVTVSNNAIVRANGGIANNSSTSIQYGTGNEENGGIVFDGSIGTVYGKVELQEDLEIGEGETLTIGDGASLNTGSHEVIVNGGTLTGGDKIEGTVKYAPAITTESLPEGTVGTAYNQLLGATGSETITWSLAIGTLPAGLTLNSDGTITGTPTTANTYNFTVTATNDSGSDSKELTLTISKPVPTYTISANADPVGAGTVSGGGTYADGDTVTLTATNNPGYRFVGWVEGEQTVSTYTTYTFTANSDRSLTAQFDRISSGSGDSDPTYSITLPSRVTGGELKLSRRYAEKGETVTLTAVPDEGYELDTLTVTDSKGNEIDLTDQGGNEYTFKMPAGRVTIDVTFRKTGTPLPFADVGETYWAYDEIAWAYENGYMSGTSATAFTPGGTVTRQQVWMILARMAGANPTDMAAAKAWAVANGISDGTSPGSPVTRQQLAALLYRYAVLYGYDVSVGENTNILSFTDVGQLSEYAIPAMQWAVGAGIINGTGDGSTLTPQGDSTRAQLAVMLYRFMGSM